MNCQKWVFLPWLKYYNDKKQQMKTNQMKSTIVVEIILSHQTSP
jgi:hypothetical protein